VTITVVAVPDAAVANAAPMLASSRSRPMKRRLTTLPDIGPIVGTPGGPPSRYAASVQPRRPPHPANDLNELSGEEWLYFTKSVWTTAYPSELGHERRKAHGANKPPRLMARLIEFFTKSGELVLDPFAGVGGTLLGAAIARGPRRAIGIELDTRWAQVFDETVAALAAERDGAGPLLADLGPTDPGGVRTFDPSGLEMRIGDALELLPDIATDSVDFVAADPPYNVQLPMTMAGGRLAETHANRRTDYAMVSDLAGDLANLPDYPAFLDAMGNVLAEVHRVLRPGRYAALIVRDAYQGGRYLFTAADLAARAADAGLVPKGDIAWYQAGTRLRPYGYPHAFVPNIAHQHIVVLRKPPTPRRGRRA
jgi:DNA modification methylase